MLTFAWAHYSFKVAWVICRYPENVDEVIVHVFYFNIHHLGLPNGYLYKNRYVYCSDMADYDILIGMDIIAKSEFFLTNIEGNSRFYFRLPAEGKAEL